MSVFCMVNVMITCEVRRPLRPSSIVVFTPGSGGVSWMVWTRGRRSWCLNVGLLTPAPLFPPLRHTASPASDRRLPLYLSRGFVFCTRFYFRERERAARTHWTKSKSKIYSHFSEKSLSLRGCRDLAKMIAVPRGWKCNFPDFDWVVVEVQESGQGKNKVH